MRAATFLGAAIIAALTIAVLVSSVPLFRFVNVTFITQDDQSGFDVSVRAPQKPKVARIATCPGRP